MSALGRVVRGGIARRRLQTVVLLLTVTVAVAAAVLATGLAVASQAPFDHAFSRQHGAQLTVQFDGSKVTAGQLSATGRTPGVTAAAGPFPVTTVRMTAGADMAGLPDDAVPPLTLAGRDRPAGAVDAIGVVQGHWVTGPGQVVLDTAAEYPPGVGLGSRVQVRGLPGSPVLTVVGWARSVGGSADGWVTPGQLAALTPPGTPAGYEMLYRFRQAATSSQVAADRAGIAAAVPSGALTGARSYLSVKEEADGNTGAFIPFVVAFAVLGLVMSVLIISIVVGGAVSAATRRIGVLKSLGFTPAQVVLAYTEQALIPSTVGTVLGVGLGNLLSVPMMGEVAGTYGTGRLVIPVWVDVAVPAVALALVAAASFGPALRAGRLRTAEVLSVGRAAETRHGRRMAGLLGRLPLPRPVSLGLAGPFARPARTATVAAAVVFGAVAVTFGVGLGSSLVGIQHDRSRDTAGDVMVSTGMHIGPGVVRVHAGADGGVAPQADPAKVAAALRAQPGTGAFYGTTGRGMSVAGISAAVQVIGYQGDSSWGAFRMTQGRWFSGPGEAVVPTRFLEAAGARVGDTVTLAYQGRSIRVRITGEAFDLHDGGMDVLTDISTLTRLSPGMQPDTFNVELRPGTDRGRYLSALNAALHPLGADARPGGSGPGSSVILVMEALIGTLTLMLVVVAGLGVLNTVVLDTRERIHDLGVFKALGMTPRQTMGMVLTSAAGIGLVAGIAGVPLGVALHHWITPQMGNAVGARIPGADIAVYHAPQLALLALGGLVIAAGGAMLPAGWAAGARTATALRTE
ncbi:FtsX-like permease family protein [Peterkaempfera sp. SMS 1(5)a]|uniref:ABC transporter permease n=1 Tax=Peterkaempfera podocarpi TaxID=3232308 RepID=UPI0036720BCC